MLKAAGIKNMIAGHKDVIAGRDPNSLVPCRVSAKLRQTMRTILTLTMVLAISILPEHSADAAGAREYVSAAGAGSLLGSGDSAAGDGCVLASENSTTGTGSLLGLGNSKAGRTVLGSGTGAPGVSLAGLQAVKEKETQTQDQGSSGAKGRSSSNAEENGGWTDHPMTALEASEEASRSSHDMSSEASTIPQYLRLVRTFDGTGQNLVQEDIYDLNGRIYQTIRYGNLTAQLHCYDYDQDGHPKAGSYMAMDFGGNDAYWYDWTCEQQKPGNGTIVYEGKSDALGNIYTWTYNTDGTLASTMDYDPDGSSGVLTVEEYTYNPYGIIQRDVTNQIDKDDHSRYVSTEYLYDQYGNATVCNVKDTAEGTKEQLILSVESVLAKNHRWREVTTTARGTGRVSETTEHYDYDQDGNLSRRIHFNGNSATRISWYDYLPTAEYSKIWQQGGYDTAPLNAGQSLNLIRSRIAQFSVPEESRPAPAALIQAFGGQVIFGTAADHQKTVLQEAYEKNEIFFYVEQLPASFFQEHYPEALEKMQRKTQQQGERISGRAVYYGDAVSMELYGAELWLDAGGTSEKIDTWAPEQ